jgi:hypothetical protein
MKQTTYLAASLTMMLAVFPALYMVPYLGLALLSVSPELGFGALVLALVPLFGLLGASIACMVAADRA